MRHRVAAVCIALGAVLVAAALALLLWNWRQERNAADSAQALLIRVMDWLEEEAQTDADFGVSSDLPDPYDPAMQEVELQGYNCLGYLSIPTIALTLPVMADWDYEMLKLAPCRYAGSTKSDDLVIAAHNYASHFGHLSQLKPGDLVYFMDMNGLGTTYQVQLLQILEPTQIESATNGEYDLVLFTCTYGGQRRVTVRCNRWNGD